MNSKIYYVIGLNSVLGGNERMYYDAVFGIWSPNVRTGAMYDDIVIAKETRRELLEKYGTRYIAKFLKVYMVRESGHRITLDEYFDVKPPIEQSIEDLKGVVEELRSYAEKYDKPIITAQQRQKSNDDEKFDINKYITSDSGGLESVDVVNMKSGTMIVSQGELETIVEERLFDLGLRELRVGPSVEIYPNLSSEQLHCILYLTADIDFVPEDFDNLMKKVDSIVPNSIVKPINKNGLDEGFVSLKLNGHRVLEGLGITLETIYLGKYTSYKVRIDNKCNILPQNDKYLCRLKSPSTNKFSIRVIKSRSYNRVEDLLKKDKLTEEEFLKVVNAGLQDKLNLRTEVTLPNSRGTTDVWVVADTNHDNTNGTVDLISKNLICDSTKIAYDENFGPSQIYRSSLLRRWLTGAYINGFSTDVQNVLKTMDVVTDENGDIVTTRDKIKLLSMNEVGFNSSYWDYISTTAEGTIYPIFEIGDVDSARAKRVKYGADGSINWYWTRSRYTGSSSDVCGVDSSGSYGIGYYTFTTGGVVAAIRF